MTGEAEPQNEHEESGLPGPGAPTPLSALEVRFTTHSPPGGINGCLICGFDAW